MRKKRLKYMGFSFFSFAFIIDWFPISLHQLLHPPFAFLEIWIFNEWGSVFELIIRVVLGPAHVEPKLVLKIEMMV